MPPEGGQGDLSPRFSGDSGAMIGAFVYHIENDLETTNLSLGGIKKMPGNRYAYGSAF